MSQSYFQTNDLKFVSNYTLGGYFCNMHAHNKNGKIYKVMVIEIV